MRTKAKVKIKPITTPQWTAAIRILQCKNVASDAKLFTAAEVRLLCSHLNGPFENGLPLEAAVKVIDYLGWRITDKEK